MLLRTSKLKENPDVAKALLGAWYETVGIINGTSPQRAEVIKALATASATDAAGYEQQLKSVVLFSDAKAALAASSRCSETLAREPHDDRDGDPRSCRGTNLGNPARILRLRPGRRGNDRLQSNSPGGICRHTLAGKKKRLRCPPEEMKISLNQKSCTARHLY